MVAVRLNCSFGYEFAAPDLRILVKSCMVSDGSGEEFMVIDENGCAIDPSIVGNLAYSQAGTQAWVPAAAFKFSDSTQMGIKYCNICMISLPYYCRCTVELCSHFNQPPEDEKSNCRNISVSSFLLKYFQFCSSHPVADHGELVPLRERH